MPIVTWIAPFALHHSLKRFLWDTEAKDTFPVAYRMNTRSSLRRLFETHGFRESGFAYLDDCRTLQRFRATLFLELATWRLLHSVGVTYPEIASLAHTSAGDQRDTTTAQPLSVRGDPTAAIRS